MADDTATLYMMPAAFIQCMIICWSSQASIDILIPVLLEKLEQSVMSGLLIQVKLH
jgi:hypothetical protein